MHQNHIGLFAGDQRQHRLIVAQGGDIVHDPRTGLERGPRDRSAARIDREGEPVPGQALDHGQDAPQLILWRGRLRARPGRLATDIDDVGTFCDEAQAIVDGPRGVEAFTAV